jgi:hypothetical protein
VVGTSGCLKSGCAGQFTTRSSYMLPIVSKPNIGVVTSTNCGKSYVDMWGEAIVLSPLSWLQHDHL